MTYYVANYVDEGVKIYTDKEKARLDMFKYYANHVHDWYGHEPDYSTQHLEAVFEDLHNLTVDTPYIEDVVDLYEGEMVE